MWLLRPLVAYFTSKHYYYYLSTLHGFTIELYIVFDKYNRLLADQGNPKMANGQALGNWNAFFS